MPISMFDHLVFGSLVLTALIFSTIAQADPPQMNSSGRHWLPPAICVYTPPPDRPAPHPQIGFNKDYRPILKHDPPK